MKCLTCKKRISITDQIFARFGMPIYALLIWQHLPLCRKCIMDFLTERNEEKQAYSYINRYWRVKINEILL